MPHFTAKELADTATARRLLRRLAVVNVALHLVGLCLAAAGIMPGSPLVSLAERLEYLAAKPPGWTLAWTTWMLCAGLLIAFLFVAASRLDEMSQLTRAALILAVVGAGFDLFCDAAYIVVLPLAASSQPLPATTFLIVERALGVASLFVANGAYSLAVLLFTLGLRGRPGLLPGTSVMGYGCAVSGMLLAAAAFTGVPWHAQWATPPTMLFYCVWVLLVAWSLAPTRRDS